MRVMIVHDEPSYILPLVEGNKLFQVISQSNLHLLSHSDIDVLVVFERCISVNKLLEKQSYLGDLKEQYYVLKKDDENLSSVCKAAGITPLILNNDEELITELQNRVYPENPSSKRLFLFMGADHNVGTTTIVHGLAEQLINNTGKKVLVVSLTHKANDEFVELSSSTIDNLRTSISSNVITFKEIYSEAENVRGYRFLAGPRDLINYRRYEVEDIIHFIEVLRNQDEYLVLIDGGSDVDNPLIMAALTRIQNKFMVIENRKSHYKSLDRSVGQLLEPYLKISHSSFLYILNHYNEELETANEIQKRNSICALTIPHSKYGWDAEDQHISLHSIDVDVRQKMMGLTKLIATKADLELVGQPIKESKIAKFLSSIKGSGKVDERFST